MARRGVGKTSLVRTLEDLPATKDLTIVYLEAGDFIDPRPAADSQHSGAKDL